MAAILGIFMKRISNSGHRPSACPAPWRLALTGGEPCLFQSRTRSANECQLPCLRHREPRWRQVLQGLRHSPDAPTRCRSAHHSMPCLLRPLQARCTLLWPVRCNPAGPPARGGRGGCCGCTGAHRRSHQCRRRSRHRGHNACRAHGFCGPANGSHTRGRTTRRARAGTGHGLRPGRWPLGPRCRHPASAAGVCSVCARRGSGLAAGCSGGVRGPRRIGSRCGTCTCARTRSHNGPRRDSG